MANYINNKQLLEAMTAYREKYYKCLEEGLEKPKIPDYIGESIWQIANNLAVKGNFNGYSRHWKEEMIGDGIENCMMYLHNFNPEKSNNPFAYFTRIIWFAFIRRIQKEKKQQYIAAKLSQQTTLFDCVQDAEYNDVTSKRVEQLKNMFEPDKEKIKKPKGLEKFVEKDE